MVKAVEKYDDETVFIRLTADNVFPDGELIDEVVADFHARSLEYLCCNGEPSGLPHGISVEVTRIKHLREAAENSASDYEREHVTPYVIRKFGTAYFDKYKFLSKGHYRCTVDLYEDYINVCRVFSKVSDPVTVNALELVDLLTECKYQPVGKESVPQLVFGTAQLGMDYGIANTRGRPTMAEAEFMLKMAISNGVEYIDTARVYGVSEDVIGRSLEHGWSGRVKVITKLSPLDDCDEDTDSSLVKARVDASVFESCARLGQRSLDVFMLHRASHLRAWNGEVWSRLLTLQDEGVIKSLGVSVQNPEELETALSIDRVNFIQMPFNILDFRWNRLREKILAVKQHRKLVVHTRSALLQGLLCSVETRRWHRAHVPDLSPVWNWLQESVRSSGCSDVVDLCFRYVRSQPWVDGVVVGMESYQQLCQNISYFNKPLLSDDQLLRIESTRPFVSEKTLNPSLWSEA